MCEILIPLFKLNNLYNEVREETLIISNGATLLTSKDANKDRFANGQYNHLID